MKDDLSKVMMNDPFQQFAFNYSEHVHILGKQ